MPRAISPQPAPHPSVSQVKERFAHIKDLVLRKSPRVDDEAASRPEFLDLGTEVLDLGARLLDLGGRSACPPTRAPEGDPPPAAIALDRSVRWEP